MAFIQEYNLVVNSCLHKSLMAEAYYRMGKYGLCNRILEDAEALARHYYNAGFLARICYLKAKAMQKEQALGHSSITNSEIQKYAHEAHHLSQDLGMRMLARDCNKILIHSYSAVSDTQAV